MPTTSIRDQRSFTKLEFDPSVRSPRRRNLSELPVTFLVRRCGPTSSPSASASLLPIPSLPSHHTLHPRPLSPDPHTPPPPPSAASWPVITMTATSASPKCHFHRHPHSHPHSRALHSRVSEKRDCTSAGSHLLGSQGHTGRRTVLGHT